MKKYLFVLILFSWNGLFSQAISIEKKIGKSKTTYTFIKKGKCKITFEDKLPSKTDLTILACIPAAFTNLDNYKVDGIYVVNGRIENKQGINKSLGGVFYIENGKCRIFQSGKGKLFNDSLFTLVKLNKASFFQQIQCIQNGKAASFKDQKLFQRRGIAILKDNSIAIIESRENITLKTFSDDLAALGIQQLIYTDMGAWDEGWYRDPKTSKPVVLGRDLSQTLKQSNWVVFKTIN